MSPIDFVRDAIWLDRARLDAYARVLLVLELITFVFLILGTHGLIVPLEKPITTDFVSFYAAGALANQGEGPAVYDQARHYLAEQAAIGAKGAGYNYFFYPPVYLLLCQALARLPYLPSFIIWETLSGLAYLWAIRKILPADRPLLPFVAYPPVLLAVGIGQNSLLSAALFGGATRLVDRRPWLSGILFGALCYKPHLGLLVPVALLAGRHFRCFIAAALTVAVLIGLSFLLYGTATWAAFLALSAKTGGTFAAGRVPFSGLISPYASLRQVGIGNHAALAVQGIISLILAAIVAIVWAGRRSTALKSVVLIAATLLALPVLLFYDLTLAAVALAWFWREATGGNGRSWFLPWEKAVFCLAFFVPLTSRSIAFAYSVPIGPLAALGLLLAAVTRLRRTTISSLAVHAPSD